MKILYLFIHCSASQLDCNSTPYVTATSSASPDRSVGVKQGDGDMVNAVNCLSYEETRDLLICFLFVLKHAGEGKLHGYLC